jgi:polar amino acid transport system substrate-binding protein
MLLALPMRVVQAACARDYTGYNTAQLGYDAFRDVNNELVGVSVDFYNELARRTGCKINIEEIPPARLDAMNRDDRVPILALAANRHRPNRSFIPVIAMTTDLIIRRDLKVTNTTVAHDTAAVVFGKISGLTYGQWGNNFLDSLPADRVDLSPSVDILYRKLAAGRIGATYGFSIMYLRNIDEYGLRDSVVVVPVKEVPRAVAGVVLSETQVAPEDLKRFQAAIIAMRDDGTVLRILSRWVGEAVAKDVLWRADRDSELK